MKYIKLFEEYIKPEFLTDPEEIKAWMKDNDVENLYNYEISKDGIVNTLDIDMVYFDNWLFPQFPFKFGHVHGSFYISDCEKLTSLEHAPTHVGRDFIVQRCTNLASLKGCPTYVGRDFIVQRCTNLANLYGAPKYPANFLGISCEYAYKLLGYTKENHNDPMIHIKVALALKDYDSFSDILEDLEKKDKLDLVDTETLIKAILDCPDLADPIMDYNLPDTIKSELKYAVNLSKSDVKAKNLFD